MYTKKSDSSKMKFGKGILSLHVSFRRHAGQFSSEFFLNSSVGIQL